MYVTLKINKYTIVHYLVKLVTYGTITHNIDTLVMVNSLMHRMSNYSSACVLFAVTRSLTCTTFDYKCVYMKFKNNNLHNWLLSVKSDEIFYIANNVGTIV